VTRDHLEIAQAINDLSRGQFYVKDSGIDPKIENLFWFHLSTEDVLFFTPHDSDKTLLQGLSNKGLLRT